MRLRLWIALFLVPAVACEDKRIDVSQFGSYVDFGGPLWDLQRKLENDVISIGAFQEISKAIEWIETFPPRLLSMERIKARISRGKVDGYLMIESVSENRGVYYGGAVVLFSGGQADAIFLGPISPTAFKSDPCASSYSWMESLVSSKDLKEGSPSRLSSLLLKLEEKAKIVSELSAVNSLPHHSTYFISGCSSPERKPFAYMLHAPPTGPKGDDFDQHSDERPATKYQKMIRPVGLLIGEVLRELGQ